MSDWSEWDDRPGSSTSDEQLDADVLERGRERATLGERVAGWLHTSDVTAFARRHPFRIAAASGLLVVAAALSFFVVTRPPPIDPVVDVTISGGFDEQFGGRRSQGPTDVLENPTLSGSYTLTVKTPGDEVVAEGVLGPGLGPPEPEVRPVTAKAGTTGYVAAVNAIDCTDLRWWTAVDDDYRIRLVRTDRYARATRYDAPLGPSAADWRTTVQTQCLRLLLAKDELEEGAVEAAPGRPEVRVALSVRNPFAYPIWLQVSGMDYAGPAPAQKVAPGEQGKLSFRTIVTECPAQGPPLPEGYDGDQNPTTPYLPVLAAVQPIGPNPDPYVVEKREAELPVAPALAHSIAEKVAIVCRGHRPVASTVTGVRKLPGTDESLRWAVDVSLAADADSVELGFGSLADSSDIDPSGWDDSTLDLPGPAKVRDGVAHARLVWEQPSCRDVSTTGPPGLYAVAVVGTRRYPTWLSLSDHQLLTAVRAACPGALSASEASGNGWS